MTPTVQSADLVGSQLYSFEYTNHVYKFKWVTQWKWSSYRKPPRRTIVGWFMGWLSMSSGDIESTWKKLGGYLCYLYESLMAITIRESQSFVHDPTQSCGRYRNASTLNTVDIWEGNTNNASLAPLQSPAKQVRSEVEEILHHLGCIKPVSNPVVNRIFTNLNWLAGFRPSTVWQHSKHPSLHAESL